MARRPRLSSFFRLSWRLRLLTIEAGWELARARLDTLRAAAHYARGLGVLSDQTAPSPAAQEEERRAAEIGAIVARVAAAMPFRALCLQQALATRRMLRRRGLPATVFLGLAHDPAERRATDEPAHAWVQTGQRVVNGDQDLERYAVVGVFS